MAVPTVLHRPTREAPRVTRLLALGLLAVALLALSAFNPMDASAMPMTERMSERACANAGGRMRYNFETDEIYVSLCKLPSGKSFSCVMYLELWGWVGECG